MNRYRKALALMDAYRAAYNAGDTDLMASLWVEMTEVRDEILASRHAEDVKRARYADLYL